MKNNVKSIIGIFVTVVGFLLFVMAQSEMSDNSRYTWSEPYSSYESQVIMMKWIGFILLISGITYFVLKWYQTIYTNKHVQDVNSVTKSEGTVNCCHCGLTVLADTKKCPRCGKSLEKSNNVKQSESCFCSQCGKQINKNEKFCSKCGNKIV